MTNLGDLLDKYERLDVLATSLSPLYVANLMTGSQRGVRYFAPSPLLKTGLAKPMCHKWAGK